MIDIPIIQWLHRIPYNQTYWATWPTQDYPNLNRAVWYWTFPLIVLNLKSTLTEKAWLPIVQHRWDNDCQQLYGPMRLANGDIVSRIASGE